MGVERSAVDLVARARIANHEDLCAERWSEARKSIDRLGTKIWWLVGLVIAGQGATILFLLTRLK